MNFRLSVAAGLILTLNTFNAFAEHDFSYINSCREFLEKEGDNNLEKIQRINIFRLSKKNKLKKRGLDLKRTADILKAATYLHYQSNPEQFQEETNGMDLKKLEVSFAPIDEFIFEHFNERDRFKSVHSIGAVDRYMVAENIFYAVAKEKSFCGYNKVEIGNYTLGVAVSTSVLSSEIAENKLAALARSSQSFSKYYLAKFTKGVHESSFKGLPPLEKNEPKNILNKAVNDSSFAQVKPQLPPTVPPRPSKEALNLLNFGQKI